MTRLLGYGLLAAAASATFAIAQDKPRGDSGASPMSGTWSYTADNGLTYTVGESFSLQLASFVQAQYQYASNEDDSNVNNFSVPRARTGIGGHAFKKEIKYFLLLDYTDDDQMLSPVSNQMLSRVSSGIIRDAWVQWDFLSDAEGSLGLRVGQAKSYFGLEATGYADGFYFVDRSIASQLFSTARSRGAWVHGTHMDKRLRWNLGAQNSDVAMAADGILDNFIANADNELTYVGNVSFDVLGNFFGERMKEFWRQGSLQGVDEARGTVGLGYMFGNNRDPGDAQDVESRSLNINTAWALPGGLGLQGEYFMRDDNPQIAGTKQKSNGWYAQAMYNLPRSGDSELQWGVGLRVSQVKLKDANDFFLSSVGLGDITEVSAVVDAFYHGHNCKTQIEYTWQDVDPDAGNGRTNNIVRLAFQLAF